MTAAAITVAGHFGELLQGRLGPSGPVALVTLPCPALAVRGHRLPGPFALHQPAGAAIRLDDARRLLAAAGAGPRGRYVLRAAMPLGGGAGASTAVRVALARLAGVADARRLAELCLASEGASDPLMFPAPERILWASRQGRILGDMPALPRLTILGGFFGPPRRTVPGDMAFPDIADLAEAWPAACARPETVAALAQASAERTLALRGPKSDPTAALARRLGALGWAMAHTGSARALLFLPGMVPQAAASGLRAAGFCRITRFEIGGGA